MGSPAQSARMARFGPFELDLHTGVLTRHGRYERLPQQPAQLLLVLVSSCGELVTREELRARLWAKDTFVDFDHGLNNAVNRIREVLRDSAASPHYIQTVPRRGYRFIAELAPMKVQFEAPFETERNNNITDTASLLRAMEAMIAAGAGDMQQAERKIDEAIRLGNGFEHFHHAEYAIASAYALMNRRDQAVHWLRRAANEGFPCYPLFAGDPSLVNLRGDLQFEIFMTELRTEWRHNVATF